MAAVDFTLTELASWFEARAEETRNWAHPVGMPGDRSLSEVWTAMREAGSSGDPWQGRDEIRGVLGLINDLAGYHGVESVGPERLRGQLVYINTGETYDATIGYDEETRTFLITTWGDWLEAVERELEEDEATEDVCQSCGEIFPIDELETEEHEGYRETTCRACMERLREPPPPTWQPAKIERLVAMLRSVEGMPIAVHMIDYDELRLAFSVPIVLDPPEGAFFYAQREQAPYSRTWVSVVDAFRRGQSDLYVTSINSPSSPQNFSIERDQFGLLAVAMDWFIGGGALAARGMESQAKVFLETPPVLWTCGQVNEIAWSPGERDNYGGVQAFVRRHEVGSRFEFDDLVVWSAADEELRQLVEDGFIKWENDDSVRKYLQGIGVCR